MSRLRGWPLVRLALALLGLNALLTFANLWPGIGVVPQLRVSVELALLVVVLALCVRFARGPSPRSAGVLAVIVSFGVLWRYADVTSRALLGRPVNLYWDGQHAWQVLLNFGTERKHRVRPTVQRHRLHTSSAAWCPLPVPAPPSSPMVRRDHRSRAAATSSCAEGLPAVAAAWSPSTPFWGR